MDASPWLAAIGGGADAIDRTRQRDEENKLANRRVDNVELAAQVRAMLEQVKEEGRNNRTDKTESGKTTRTNIVEGGKNDRLDTTEAGRNERLDTVETGRNTRQANALDQGSEQYWDKAGRDWSGLLMKDSTQRRGQDVTARGQDLGASTAARGQDLVHGDRQDAMSAGSDSRAMSYALRAYDAELKRKKAAGPFGGDSGVESFGDWLQTSDDPEIFPSVRQQFGGRAAAPAAPTSAPATVPGEGLPPRPAMPAGRTPVMPAASAPAPKGLQPGAKVRLKNGTTVVVKKINPDGTFEY